MKRGQSSFEYIMMVGIVLMLLLPIFYYGLNKSSENIKLSQAEDLVNTIAKAADEVYTLGPGSKKFVWVMVPAGVQSANISGSELYITLNIFGESSDIVAFTQAPLTGEIPLEKGTYKIAVEHLDSGVVLIGPGDDSIPPTITWTYPTTLGCNPVTLRTTTNEASTCKFDTSNISYSSMANNMEGSALGHNYDFGVQYEGDYSYYVACRDTLGNTMDNALEIAFTINLTLCSEEQVINETLPPKVLLLSPASGTLVNSSRTQFYYNVSDDSPILLCKLIANGTILNTAVQPLRGANNISGDLDAGTYSWSVNCTDVFGNEDNSTTWTINVNATLDDDNPVVALSIPYNGSIRNFNLIRFHYNVSDLTSAISSCTLSIIGELDGGEDFNQDITDNSITESVPQNFSLSLEKGNFSWYIYCRDNSIYQNIGTSPDTRWLRVNSTTEEAFITSCPGQCGLLDYSNGVCRQEPTKCVNNGETYSEPGDVFCTGGAQSDTCCCVP
ncbi:MAG: hypothetical protein Q8Q35_03845 [Nanoarchaeota archaeon]|nr:hypothetical protein [Nanoarchaeota archaeon]